MTTTLRKDGRLLIPRVVRQQLKLRAGDEFEIIADSDDPGEFELRRKSRKGEPDWVDVLLACPVKGFMPRVKRRKEPMRKVRL